MTRTKRFLAGVRWGIFNLLLVNLVGLWLTPFYLNQLGQKEYGLWLMAAQLIGYLLLIDCGIIAILPREIGYATGRAGDWEKAVEIPGLIAETVRLTLWQMPVVIGIVLVIWLLLPTSWEALHGPLGFLSGGFVFLFPLRIFSAMLVGLQDQPFLGRIHLLAWLVNTLGIVAALEAGWGIYSFVWGWLLLHLVTVMGCGWRIRKRFTLLWPSSFPGVSLQTMGRRLSRSLWVTLTQLAHVLTVGTDLLLIGIWWGSPAVVCYTCTGKIITILSHFPQMIMQVAGPAISEARMAQSKERLFQICTTLGQAMLFLSGAIACLTLIVNRGFVTWWVGNLFFHGWVLTGLLVCTMLLRHWNTTMVYTLFACGYERHICLTSMGDGVITVLATLLFVNLWGALGAPLGSLMGVCLFSLPRNATALTAEVHKPVVELLQPLKPYGFVCGGLALIAGVTGWFWTPSSFLSIFFTVLLVFLFYGLGMFPVVWRSSLGTYLRPWILAKSYSTI